MAARLTLTWDQLVMLQQNRDLPDVDRARLWPEWHERAACAGSDVEFFPPRGSDPRPAKALCAGCEVRGDCLDYAMEQGPTLKGVWGGMSARERRTVRRSQSAETYSEAS